MEENKALSLFSEIAEKTRLGRLNWQETAEEGIFVVPMGGRYTIKAFPFTTATPTQQGPPSITVYEENKILVDFTMNMPGLPVRAVVDLYALIQRKVARVDEKLDDVLSQLRKL